MQKVVRFLEENRMGAFATVDNGKPRVRPWGFMLEENGRLYFCTANTKDVYQQLQTNPFMEFTSTSKDMVTVRVSGEVVFTDDKAMKAKILANNPNLTAMYESADNPIFEVFYVEHGEASIADFSGQPPKEFKF